ncbi:unnamed protein product [Spirodela intermedia]|uniref:Uncharacterized protein n=2 Tax=Spirodela intermedia TaxID=51605 RepID=A0A7I8KM03_SPIIN|nr:unnamed protein product [Spirodela intermedia]CAA7398819.1 unnamed protein product [Spirodela intermedia]
MDASHPLRKSIASSTNKE